MLKQLLQNSLLLLRRPTIKTFQEVSIDSWKWAFIYLVIGKLAVVLTGLVVFFLPALTDGQEWSDAIQFFSLDSFTSLLHDPYFLFTFITGFFWVFWDVFFFVFLAYWLGRALGGSKSFGKFAYNSSIFITPLNILGLLFPFLLIVVFYYFLYLNLQAAMGLSKGKSMLVILIPIIPLTIGLAFFLYLLSQMPTG